LKNTTVADSLAVAVRGCTLIAGTGTLTHRKPEQRVARLPDLCPLVRNELERGGRFALVFGPEKHGLTKEDLSYCQILVEIPTDEKQPSMNLGQAVAVCLYELTAHTYSGTKLAVVGKASSMPPPVAKSGSLELLAGVVEQVMDAARYSPATMREANRHDVRLLLRRLAPTEKDVAHPGTFPANSLEIAAVD
jgi:tRNA C32,U32 (ribose-2'-O)-methylase TrmJ